MRSRKDNLEDYSLSTLWYVLLGIALAVAVAALWVNSIAHTILHTSL